MEELKKWAVNQHLGEEVMQEKSIHEIFQLQMGAQTKMVQAAGGQKNGIPCQRLLKLRNVQRW